MFKELFVESKTNLSDVVKQLNQHKNIKSAKINNDKNIDIKTTGDVKAWETDGTGELFKKLNLKLKHAYDGLAGKSYEMTMNEDIAESEKIAYKGGDKADTKEIEKYIKAFDYFVGRIDDRKKYNKVLDQNDMIKDKLREFGVTEFTPIGGKPIKL